MLDVLEGRLVLCLCLGREEAMAEGFFFPVLSANSGRTDGYTPKCSYYVSVAQLGPERFQCEAADFSFVFQAQCFVRLYAHCSRAGTQGGNEIRLVLERLSSEHSQGDRAVSCHPLRASYDSRTLLLPSIGLQIRNVSRASYNVPFIGPTTV